MEWWSNGVMAARLPTSVSQRCNPGLTPLAAAFTVAPGVGPAGRAFLLWARDIDGERPPLKFFVMKLFDGLAGVFRRGELDESEAARFAGDFIQHQIDRGNGARLG